MPEYDMPTEEQVKVLVKEFRNFKGSMESFKESMETFKESMESFKDSMETFKESVDTRFDSIDSKLTTVDTKIDKMQLLLEDTRAIAKVGLEGLRESTDAKFAAATKINGEQVGLLNSVLVHVRNRVERVERPPAKGRRR
jgi:hypothetical protein